MKDSVGDFLIHRAELFSFKGAESFGSSKNFPSLVYQNLPTLPTLRSSQSAKI